MDPTSDRRGGTTSFAWNAVTARARTFLARRMIRRNEMGRALASAGPYPDLEVLSALGLHLSVLARAHEAGRVSQRLAVAIALAAVGESSKACALLQSDRSAMGPADRTSFAASIAMWDPAAALDWLPGNNHAARCACFATLNDLAQANREFSAIDRRRLHRPQEWFALSALLKARAGEPRQAQAAIDAMFAHQEEAKGGKFRSAPDKPNDRPLVSVLMPARNAAATIAAAVRSILGQTHQALELLVIDDASEDMTRDVALSAFGGDPRARVLSLDNRAGPAEARNRGLAEARGAFIALQDADDWSHPSRVGDAVRTLERTGADALVSDLIRVGEDGIVVASRVFPLIRLNPSSLIFRRSVWDRIGSFETAEFGSDTEYLARIITYLGPRALIRDKNVSMLAALRAGSLTFRSSSAIDRPDAARRRIAYRERWLRKHAERLRAGPLPY